MPWVCKVCDLKNVEDSSLICDLCGEPKANAGPRRTVEEKRKSLVALLHTTPDAFSLELQEQRLAEALAAKQDTPPQGVFGVLLTSRAPRVVCDCLAYIEDHGMETEGIFRIPGEQDTVDAMRAAYEKDESRDVIGDFKCEPNDVATLCKTYFRVLPEPLLPVTHYTMLMDAVRAEHATKENLVAAVVGVIDKVPSPQRECLGMIINFLKTVAKSSEKNKMTPANLATCFAPSLLRAPDTVSPQDALMDMSACIGALNILIRHEEDLPQPTAEEIAANTVYKKRVRSAPRTPVGPPPGMFGGGPPPGMGGPPPPGLDVPASPRESVRLTPPVAPVPPASMRESIRMTAPPLSVRLAAPPLSVRLGEPPVSVRLGEPPVPVEPPGEVAPAGGRGVAPPLPPR